MTDMAFRAIELKRPAAPSRLSWCSERVLASLCCLMLLTLVITSRPGAAVSKESYVPSVETKRSDVPATYKWDTSIWFKDGAAWEAAIPLWLGS